MRYGIKTILIGVLIAASVCTFAVYRNPTAYLLISILLPVAIGIACRFHWRKSESGAFAVVFGSAIVVSAALCAYGSFYLTFVEPSVGILIGAGWSSVVAAAIVGVFTGAVCGLFSMLIYALTRAAIGLTIDIHRNQGLKGKLDQH